MERKCKSKGLEEVGEGLRDPQKHRLSRELLDWVLDPQRHRLSQELLD